jgi:hypothetical protein
LAAGAAVLVLETGLTAGLAVGANRNENEREIKGERLAIEC